MEEDWLIHCQKKMSAKGPKGGKYSIQLNEFVDELAKEIRKEADSDLHQLPRQAFF